jgi:hypothetical protein
MPTSSGLAAALELALSRLSEVDILLQCRNAGAFCQASGSGTMVTLPYLGQSYRIELPAGQFDPPAGIRDRLLMLHYLLLASGEPPAGNLVTFKELPGGAIYAPVFYARAVKPLLARFGSYVEELISAGKQLDGSPSDYGDVSIIVPALPLVSVTISLWRGDTELPAEASFLFDASITGYLETEGITVLCQLLTSRLVAG